MVDMPQHDRDERLAIAAVCGGASRLARQLARGEVDLAAAIAELHTHTDKPHLLAHGVRPRGDEYDAEPIEQLLLAAGATAEDIAQVRADQDERLHAHRPGVAGLAKPG
jgi:hypothetical protein